MKLSGFGHLVVLAIWSFSPTRVIFELFLIIFVIARTVQFHIISNFSSCCEIFGLMIRKTVSMKMLALKFFLSYFGFCIFGRFSVCVSILCNYIWLRPEVFNSNKLNIGEHNIQTSFSINVRGGRLLIERTSGNKNIYFIIYSETFGRQYTVNSDVLYILLYIML